MATNDGTAELSGVTIRCPNVFIQGQNLEFRRFLSYTYTQDFLIPSDQWSFTVAEELLTDIELTALTPRTRVEFLIDGVRQTVGIIDELKTRSDRSGGTILTVEGRDWLSPAVDCHVDPKSKFKPTMSILDVVTETLGPFGVKVFSDDNTANRNAITGSKVGIRRSKRRGKPLASKINHQLKPYINEGAFAFASRVTQRAGLWIWPAADGETVQIGEPEYDQDATYSLWHTRDQSARRNNVEASDVCQSAKDQPSVIISFGGGGGGEFAKSTLKTGVFNPVVDLDNEARSSILNAYPEIRFLGLPASTAAFEPVTEPGARPLYLFDPESHTPEQLQFFTYRELSMCLRKSLSAKYTFEGHKLQDHPVAIDTLVQVEDDRSSLHTSLWVLNRRFTKDAHSGTKTTVELIRPGSIVFSGETEQ